MRDRSGCRTAILTPTKPHGLVAHSVRQACRSPDTFTLYTPRRRSRFGATITRRSPLKPEYRDDRSLNWIKSSRSTLTQECVEVTRIQDHHLVRDSKDPGGPILAFRHSSWRVFISNVRSGFYETRTRMLWEAGPQVVSSSVSGNHQSATTHFSLIGGSAGISEVVDEPDFLPQLVDLQAPSGVRVCGKPVALLALVGFQLPSLPLQQR